MQITLSKPNDNFPLTAYSTSSGYIACSSRVASNYLSNKIALASQLEMGQSMGIG